VRPGYLLEFLLSTPTPFFVKSSRFVLHHLTWPRFTSVSHSASNNTSLSVWELSPGSQQKSDISFLSTVRQWIKKGWRPSLVTTMASGQQKCFSSHQQWWWQRDRGTIDRALARGCWFNLGHSTVMMSFTYIHVPLFTKQYELVSANSNAPKLER